MLSKTSFFNNTVFKKTVFRFWVIWFLYAVIMIIALPVAVGSQLNFARVGAEYYGYESVAYTIGGYLFDFTIAGGLAFGMVMFIPAGAVFSHLYKPKTTSGFGALPVRREGQYFSVMLGGLLPGIAINAIVFGITAIMEFAMGFHNMTNLLTAFCAFTLIEIFFYAIAVLCTQLTGHIVVVPLLFGFFNFIVFAVEGLIALISELFVYGYHNDFDASSIFTPLFKFTAELGSAPVYDERTLNDGVVERFITDYQFEGMGLLVAYAAVGVLILLGSVFLYKRRAMETAGDALSFNVLKPVFKYIITLLVGLSLGITLLAIVGGASLHGMMNDAVLLCALTIPGAVIGYFAVQIAISKNLRVVKDGKNWVKVFVSVLVLSAVVMAIELDATGYESDVPDPSSVESVYISSSGYDATLKLEENIEAFTALHATITENKDYHESWYSYDGVDSGYIAGVHETAYEPPVPNRAYVRVVYTFDSGETMQRRYYLNPGLELEHTDWQTLEDILNTDEARMSRIAVLTELTLDNNIYSYIEYNVPNPEYVPVEDTPLDSTEYVDVAPMPEYSDPYVQNNIHLTPQQVIELYYDCIVPDTEDGLMNRAALYDDMSDYNYDVYAFIEYTYDVPEELVGEVDRYHNMYFNPTVDSYRTNEFLEELGVEFYTFAETRPMYYD